jgi:hypothetical protein
MTFNQLYNLIRQKVLIGGRRTSGQNMRDVLDAIAEESTKKDFVADITNKPATFPPSAHGHAINDVSGLGEDLEIFNEFIGNVGDPSNLAKIQSEGNLNLDHNNIQVNSAGFGSIESETGTYIRGGKSDIDIANATLGNGIRLRAKNSSNQTRTEITLSASDAFFRDHREVKTGLREHEDYSANYTDLSYVNKKFVEDSINRINIVTRGAQTGGVNNTSLFTAIVNELDANGGGVIYVPEGAFTGRMSLKHNITVMGDGYNSVLIDPPGLGDGAPVQIYNANNCKVLNIRLNGNKENIGEGTPLNYECIDLKADFGTYIDQVWLENSSGDGIDLDGSEDFYIGTVYAKNCGGSAIHPSWSGSKMAKKGHIDTVFAENCGIDKSRFAVDCFSFDTFGCEDITIGRIFGKGNFGEFKDGTNARNITIGFIETVDGVNTQEQVQLYGKNITIGKVTGKSSANRYVFIAGSDIEIGAINVIGGSAIRANSSAVKENVTINSITMQRTIVDTNVSSLSIQFANNFNIGKITAKGLSKENVLSFIDIIDSSYVHVGAAYCDFVEGGSGNLAGVRIVRSNNCIINANIQNARTEGISLDNSNHNTIYGTYRNNGKATGYGNSSTLRSGIRIMGTSTGNKIHATAKDTQGTKTQVYGIYEENTTGANIITNSVATGNITSQIITNNANTINANNLTV